MLRRIHQRAIRFARDVRGNVAIVFTLTLPMLMVCMGMAVDYTVWTNQRQELQRIADEAALAAARELYLANASSSQAETVAQESATNSLVSAGHTTTTADSSASDPSSSDADAPSSPASSTTFGDAVTVETVVNMNESSVEVTVRQAGVGFFSPMFFQPPVIRVTSTARANGGGRVCVIALDPSSDKALILASDASLTANRCGVYSNSTDETGLSAYRNAVLTSELACSAGGYGGSSVNFSPEPITDCPAMADPLASRAAPDFGGCDETDFTVTGVAQTLSPGVYCGGIGIYNGADITFEPGVYIIKDGPLSVTSTSQVRGEGVGFYFTGPGSDFTFAARSLVRLSAPRDGPMAGLLFFQDRNSPVMQDYQITSEDAGVLTGTIYLPNGRFLVSSKNPVARDSPYTAIVAREISLYRASSIVINSDYNLTDVPVPSGLGDTTVGRNIILTK